MTSRIVVSGSLPVRAVKWAAIIAVDTIGQVGGALLEVTDNGRRLIAKAKGRVRPAAADEIVDDVMGPSLVMLGVVWALRFKMALEDAFKRRGRGTP